jgi:hypothetical protein
MKIKYKVPIEAGFPIISEIESFAFAILTRRQDMDHAYVLVAENCAAEVLIRWAIRHKKYILDSSGLDRYTFTIKNQEESFALLYFFAMYSTQDHYLYPILMEWCLMIDKITKNYLIGLRRFNGSNEFVSQLPSSNTPTLGPGEEWMQE